MSGSVRVLIPSRGTVDISFALSLARLRWPVGSGPEDIVALQSYGVDVARNRLARRATSLDEAGLGDFGAERVFFLDDDMVVPPDTLLRLIEVQDRLMARSPKSGEVVSGLYYLKRSGGSEPAAWHYRRGEDVYEVVREPKGEMVVDAVGAGMLLVHGSVFRSMSSPWFKFDGESLPPVSEDLFFCRKVAVELGIRPVLAADVVGEHLTMARLKDGTLRL